jgi:hypothetical protein
LHAEIRLSPTLEFSGVGLLRHATLDLGVAELISEIENCLGHAVVTTFFGIFAFG